MTSADIYTKVTNQIIEAMEKGEKQFQMPWHSTKAHITAPINASSGRMYRGINAVSLWAAARGRGFSTGFWATYQQWKTLGAQVRKGEKSSDVVLWKTCEKAKDDGDEPDKFMIARGFAVFNADQVDGFVPEEIPELSESKRVQAAESFFATLRLDVRYGGERAYYDITADYIQMPEYRRFRTASAFYSTLAHETVHWTGSEQRLNRDLKSRFGEQQYAAEELIAELGAAFLAARIGGFAEPRGNHAAYLASWLKLLRSDKRAIFTAASQAQKAVDWLCDRAQPTAVAA
jgi:antirestriction protein ArdC